MTAGSKSLALTLTNLYETFSISWPTVVDATMRRVRKDVCDERLRAWSVRVIDHCRAELDVRGEEHLEEGARYVIMSNHQSLYDIPVLFRVFGGNVRMITKKELFRIPVFGPAMREAGFISIDRGNRRSAVRSLEIAKEVAAGGTHVWIAPEGTRSLTGELGPFKKGGFNLAIEANLPVLPVSLRGTRDILRSKGVRSARGASVTVTIHRPLAPGAYPGPDLRARRAKLMTHAREAIARGL